MYNIRKDEIAKNIESIKQEINEIALESNRDPKEIKLICVSKNYPLEDILFASETGATEFGENRVQEMQAKQLKYQELEENIQKSHPLNWHLIGTLQRNKVKDVIGKTDLIHSVDSLRLIEQISRVSKRLSVTTEFLLQVNVSKEDTKHGFETEELESVLEHIMELDNIKVRGLMTMAPYFEDAVATEPIFAETKQLLERFKPIVGEDFNQLSMGMSNDYQFAIAQGATLIRVGTRIFGARNY